MPTRFYKLQNLQNNCPIMEGTCKQERANDQIYDSEFSASVPG